VINQAMGVITAGFDSISGFTANATNSGSIFAGHDGIFASSADATSKSGGTTTGDDAGSLGTARRTGLSTMGY
jgi:hypothetical protein